LYLLQDGRLLWFSPDCPDRPLGVLDFSLVRYELHCCWKAGEEEGSPSTGKPETPSRLDSEEKLPGGGCCDCCEDCLCGAPPADWRVFYLKPPAFPRQIFCFRGPEKEVKELAASLFKLLVSVAPPQRRAERAVVSLRNFWRYPFVEEEDFVHRAESGDLLLFRGLDVRARLQRRLTGALYDHVGLLLRLGPREDQVYLLEAMGVDGVTWMPWVHFKERQYHKAYAWVAFRKVYFARTNERMANLEMFVSAVLGRPYGLTVGKLLRGRALSTAFDDEGAELPRDQQPWADGEEGPIEVEGRSFFCSELCAICLKHCGVLAGAASSATYWPGSFSQHSHEQLPLHAHAHLGSDEVIVFGNLGSGGLKL
jgi:hypothetical protein